MDWATYKALCNQPDVWSRWMLEQSEELLTLLAENELCLLLHNARSAQPLPMPEDHRLQGHQPVQMFQLRLPQAVRRQILAVMQRAKVRGLFTEATRERGLGGFCEAWQEFVDYPE